MAHFFTAYESPLVLNVLRWCDSSARRPFTFRRPITIDCKPTDRMPHTNVFLLATLLLFVFTKSIGSTVQPVVGETVDATAERVASTSQCCLSRPFQLEPALIAAAVDAEPWHSSELVPQALAVPTNKRANTAGATAVNLWLGVTPGSRKHNTP